MATGPRWTSPPDENPELIAVEFAALARRLLDERRDDFIRDLFASLREEVGELVSDTRLTNMLEAAVTENIVSIVNYLEQGTDIENLDATSAALAHARTLAQRDVPLSALFRAYRLGHVRFMEIGLDLMPGVPGELRGPLTRALVRRSAEFIDKVCEQVGRAYDAERDQWVGERGGIRQHWVREILSGRPIDLAAAESAIGYRLHGSHLGVQMWTSSTGSDAGSRTSFEEARRILTAVLRPVKHPLIDPRDENEVHAWFPVRADLRLDADELSQAFRAARQPWVHVAVGRLQTGVEGFRLTMRQAERAKDLVLASSKSPPPTVTYDQLGSVALMTSDFDALQQFVIQTLGPLAAPGEREDYLRTTLRSFLARNCSYIATAEDLVLHRNTVRYRINQALELCGRDIADISVDFNIQVALNAAHWLGRTVLADR